MKTILSLLAVAALILLGLSFAAGQSAPATQEWTQDFHDAQRTGYTPEEPVEPWRLLWTWNGPDANGGTGKHIYHAPREARTVTGGSSVYVPAGSRGLYALSKQNGAVVWNVTNTAFNAAPAYDPANAWVFASGADGNLYKINAQSGAVLQTYNAGNPLNKAVLLVGSFAYVVTDNGQLHKVNIATMARAWMYAANAAIAIPPAYSPSRDAILYATNDLYVHAVNNATGSQKWRVKPTVNPAGFPNEFDLAWPVIAEQHGVVFIRMRLDHNALWSGPGKGNMYPNTNAATRAHLQSKPNLKNLFALSLDTGAEAFIPAVGYGGVEDTVNGAPYLDVNSLPVVRVIGGKEVAYQIFRSGQSNPPDGRWDSHLGEMVLDDQTIPGLVAGDLRFIQFTSNPSIKVTDEQTPLSMAGETIFNAHWGASTSTKIVDRSASRGLTFGAPITTQSHPTLIRRQQSCGDFNPTTHWTTCGLTLFSDGRFWPGPGWWTYWNVIDPAVALPSATAYSAGVLPRYTYVSDGLIITSGNGGELMVFKHSGVSAPAPTTPPQATATQTKTPTTVPTTPPPTLIPPTQVPPSNGTPQVTTLTASAPQVGLYQKFELTFQISKTFAPDSFLPYYPYDPADSVGVNGITIDAHFLAPSGREVIAPAFYYQDYVRTVSATQTTMTPTNNFAWKVRFAPEEVGGYSYYITILDKNGTTRYPASGSLPLQVVSSASKGFVRVSPRDSRFFEFSNGQSFVPNSSGRQWWSTPLRSAEYEQALAEFGRNGVNLTRIWDQNDGYALTVEGHFDHYKFPDDYNPEGRIDLNTIPKGTQMNQRGNYEEDRIIEAAERNGVYIQLCSHGDAYWIWEASVWNNPPAAPDDPARIRYWQRNFRYRVARWGYSTAILAWEHWNELGHVAVNSPIYRFYETYSQYQQQADPYRHLRTTSQGSQSWSPAFWSSNLFDYANYHDYMMISRYPADLTYDAANFTYRFAQCLRTVNGQQCGLGLGDGSSWQGAQKPYIWGELDTGTTNWNEANPRPKATHDMRWAGLFSPIGMAPIDWYWQQQSASFQAQKHAEAKIAANFFQGMDYAGKRFTYLSTSDVRLTSEVITASQPNLRVLAMRAQNGGEAYAWVQNKGNSRWDSTAVPSPLSGTFVIPQMAAGSYSVQYWDTYTGQITAGGVVTASNGNVTVAVNNLTKDIAIKILPTNQTVPTPTPAPPTLTPTRVPPTLTPTFTPTRVPPTLTPTNIPPTFTPTNVPPTLTPTRLPPTLTPTNVPPTAVPPTLTPTSVPPTFTPTSVPPTLTPTSIPPTSVPPTLTATAVPPTIVPSGPAVQIEVNPATAQPGAAISVTLNLINVTDLYGLQAQCAVNPTVLQGQGHADGAGFNGSNSFFADQGFQADGAWLIAASRLRPTAPIAGTMTAFSLNYAVLSANNSAVTCTVLGVNADGETVPLQIINGSFNGVGQGQGMATPTPVIPSATPVPPTTIPSTLTAMPATAKSIQGVATYQNRKDNAGITVQISAQNQVLAQVVTNANGVFRFTDVPAGTYTITLSAPQHLSLVYTVTMDANGNPVDLGQGVLRAGDTDGSKLIDLVDAAFIGANFNITAPPAPANADLNGDGQVNIADLALVGSNFGLIGPMPGN